jgi:hypothetical protein
MRRALLFALHFLKILSSRRSCEDGLYDVLLLALVIMHIFCKRLIQSNLDRYTFEH